MSQILTASMGTPPQGRPKSRRGGRRRDWERASMIGLIAVTAAGQRAAERQA